MDIGCTSMHIYAIFSAHMLSYVRFVTSYAPEDRVVLITRAQKVNGNIVSDNITFTPFQLYEKIYAPHKPLYMKPYGY